MARLLPHRYLLTATRSRVHVGIRYANQLTYFWVPVLHLQMIVESEIHKLPFRPTAVGLSAVQTMFFPTSLHPKNPAPPLTILPCACTATAADCLLLVTHLFVILNNNEE